ncbi:MAG: HD-GYP domain-containing protein [Candidatus Caldatribacteriaceae bacterium]
MEKAQGVRIKKIPIAQFEPGQVLTFTLLDEKGQMLLGKGKQVTLPFLEKLKTRGQEYVFIEVLEEVETIAAKEDVSFETKQKTLDDLQETLTSLSRGKEVPIQPLEQDVRKIIQEVKSHRELVIPIIQLKKHDDFTFTHSLNVSILATFIGKFLGLGEEEIRILGLGALLHDLGKLNVPSEILNKPQPLTQEEYAIIQQHPVIARKILDEQTRLAGNTKSVALEHHEKLDGSGYPRRLWGNDISFLAQITAVADIYEALTSDRPYRKALPVFEVVEYLMGNAGYKLNDRVIGIFVNHISPYQVGDVVRLSNGEEAVVTRLNPIFPFRPFVRIRKPAPDGTVVLSEEIDLSRSLVLTIVGEIELKSQVKVG